MTDTPDLREKITALFHDGYLYRESPGAIADAILAVVEPEIDSLNLEIMRYQAPGGEYEVGHDHGSRLARKFRDERDAAEASRRDWAAEAAESEARFQDLLGAIWLYVDWRYVTKQLTTEQKELWADAVDASGDPDYRDEPRAERWWRDSGSVFPDGGAQ